MWCTNLHSSPKNVRRSPRRQINASPHGPNTGLINTASTQYNIYFRKFFYNGSIHVCSELRCAIGPEKEQYDINIILLLLYDAGRTRASTTATASDSRRSTFIGQLNNFIIYKQMGIIYYSPYRCIYVYLYIGVCDYTYGHGHRGANIIYTISSAPNRLRHGFKLDACTVRRAHVTTAFGERCARLF